MSTTALAVAESVGIMAAIDQIDTREKFAAVITDRFGRIYRDVVEIGGLLAEARRSLSYHEFQGLIEHDLPFGRTTTYAYMREWTLFEAGQVRTSERLSDSYRARIELDRLDAEEMSRGIAEGKLYPGVPVAKVIIFRKELRAEHQHRPEAGKIPAPSRPTGPTRSYSELVYCLAEWRKSKGISQAALDDIIGWGDGQTSKYEIPHQDDGRVASWDKLSEWMQGLGVGISLVGVP